MKSPGVELPTASQASDVVISLTADGSQPHQAGVPLHGSSGADAPSEHPRGHGSLIRSFRRGASRYAGSFGIDLSSSATGAARAPLLVLVLAWFRANQTQLLAGLTSALAAVPTSVAFSFLAAATPQVGLHGSWLVGLTAALLGGRTGMIYVNAGAVAVVVAPLVRSNGLGASFYAFILAGIMQLAMVALAAPKLLRLLGQPVMTGCARAAAPRNITAPHTALLLPVARLREMSIGLTRAIA